MKENLLKDVRDMFGEQRIKCALTCSYSSIHSEPSNVWLTLRVIRSKEKETLLTLIEGINKISIHHELFSLRCLVKYSKNLVDLLLRDES